LAYFFREHREKKGAVLLSVVLDRLIGLFVLIPFTLLVVVTRYDWLSQTPIAHALLWFLIGFIGCMSAVIGAAILLSRFHLAGRLPGWMPGRGGLARLAEALAAMGRAWKQTAMTFALSFPVFFCVFGTFYCAARAFGAGVSLVDISSIMPVVIVVTSFPISFSGLGVREQLFKDLLGSLAHVPGQIAVLISLTGFLIDVCWSLVGAVLYLGYGGQPARSKNVSAPT